MMSDDTVRKWVCDYKEEHDEQQHAPFILIDEELAKIKNFVGQDRRLTLDELYVLIGISRSQIYEVIMGN